MALLILELYLRGGRRSLADFRPPAIPTLTGLFQGKADIKRTLIRSVPLYEYTPRSRYTRETLGAGTGGPWP
jgi:hypothetical protein